MKIKIENCRCLLNIWITSSTLMSQAIAILSYFIKDLTVKEIMKFLKNGKDEDGWSII